jgi:hypothetical protein
VLGKKPPMRKIIGRTLLNSETGIQHTALYYGVKRFISPMLGPTDEAAVVSSLQVGTVNRIRCVSNRMTPRKQSCTPVAAKCIC